MTRSLTRLALVTGLAWASLGQGQESMLYSSKSLTTRAAYKAAQAAFDHCQGKGYLAAVTVVDRSGLALVVLRDMLAGFHTLELSLGKARTAASFRGVTTELAAATSSETAESGIRHAQGVIMLGGGMPIEAGGQLVGAIGVSGAPGVEADDECARAGLDAIQSDLEFAAQ